MNSTKIALLSLIIVSNCFETLSSEPKKIELAQEAAMIAGIRAAKITFIAMVPFIFKKVPRYHAARIPEIKNQLGERLGLPIGGAIFSGTFGGIAGGIAGYTSRNRELAHDRAKVIGTTSGILCSALCYVTMGFGAMFEKVFSR